MMIQSSKFKWWLWSWALLRYLYAVLRKNKVNPLQNLRKNLYFSLAKLWTSFFSYFVFIYTQILSPPKLYVRTCWNFVSRFPYMLFKRLTSISLIPQLVFVVWPLLFSKQGVFWAKNTSVTRNCITQIIIKVHRWSRSTL